MAYIPFNNIYIYIPELWPTFPPTTYLYYVYTHIPELWPTFPPTTYLYYIYYVYTHIPELWPTFPPTVVALQRSLPV